MLFYTIILCFLESIIPLAIGGVCMLFVGVFVAVLVKYFAIDLALFFRPYFPLSSSNKGKRVNIFLGGFIILVLYQQ